MDTDLLQKSAQNAPSFPAPEQVYVDVKKYYSIAGPDYEIWSRDFNMHFGYYKKLRDIFSLEKMLVNMSDVKRRKHFGYYLISGRKI